MDEFLGFCRAMAHPLRARIFPELADYDAGVSGHLETVRRASEALDIPVIASLNGTTAEGWIDYARNLELASAWLAVGGAEAVATPRQAG